MVRFIGLKDWYGDPCALRPEAVLAVCVADEHLQHTGSKEVLTVHLAGGSEVHVRYPKGVEAFLRLVNS